jgi:hypothetical protein
VGANGSQVPIVITLTCENAIAAAWAAVGPDPAVASIDFHYGRWCPPGALCAATLPNQGYVIFHRSGQGRDVMVLVEADDAGKVTAHGPQAAPSPSVPAATGFRGLPIDTSLEAVSPDDPEVAAALNLCVRPDQRPLIVGMARLPANEIHRFMLTNGNEPELAADELAWAIQLQGHVLISTRAPAGNIVVINPLCVVIGGTPTTYAPYGQEGTPFSPPPDFVWPAVALPPLLPSSSPRPDPSAG